MKETNQEQIKNLIEQKMQHISKIFESLPEKKQKDIYIQIFDSITQTLIKASSRTGENGLTIAFHYLEAIISNLPLSPEGRRTTVLQCKNIISLVSPKDDSFQLH